METETAKIFVTKLSAAERQLNKAIRLFLANDDPLAVHTLGAAAHGILRSLKQRRTGRDDSHDLFLVGLFSTAQDLENGEKESIPTKLADPTIAKVIEAIREGIRNGAIKEPADVSVIEKSGFWKKFNASANFLKHANEDPDSVLDLAKLRNEELLMRVAGAFIQITNRLSPMIEALLNRVEASKRGTD